MFPESKPMTPKEKKERKDAIKRKLAGMPKLKGDEFKVIDSDGQVVVQAGTLSRLEDQIHFLLYND